MRSEETRVSLADLSAVGVRLKPSESVTLVRELIAQVLGGVVPGVPSAHVIRLSMSGHVTVEGPVAAGRAVARAATLLDSLLPPFDAPAAERAPGALRLVVARALGTLDLPAYGSLEAFSSALERFAEPDAGATARRLADQWARAASGSAGRAEDESRTGAGRRRPEPNQARAAAALVRIDPASVTVSDIRRARRATGLTLIEISKRSRIPVPLLRQLEWGYLLNWPAGQYGRTQLVRYARASGLDETRVLAAVWPLVQDVAAAGEAAPVRAHEEAPPAGSSAGAARARPDDLPLRDVPPESEPAGPGRPRWRLAAAAALLAVSATLAAIIVQERSLPVDAGEIASLLQPAGDSSDRGDAPAAPPEPTRDPDTPPARAAASGNPQATAPPVSSAGGVATAGDSGSDPRAAAARGIDADEAWTPALALEGSATFQDTEAAALRPASADEGAILRITRVVDDGARNFHARVSPDGTRIAFDSDRDGERGVYVADANGANVRRVSGEGFAAIPSWAPDGRRLAFVRAEPDRPRVWNLWLVDLESATLRRLTSHDEGQPWGASWFPDGRRLAYSRGDRLAVLDVATGRARTIASPRPGRAVGTPAVSPDGRRMIVQVDGDGAWLLDLDEGSTRKVLADPTADEYVWSPDGRRVAYHSRQSGEWGVWLMVSR